MNIRRAEIKDMEKINDLLYQVLMVHHNARPDLFKANKKKYTDEELINIIKDDNSPIFVATDENNTIMGYAFCVFKRPTVSNIFNDIKTLYIDDLCVDEKCRGKNIGKELYNYVVNFAKETNCYSVTLNVWYDNKSALEFYKKLGLTPQKIGMEKIL